MRYNLAFLFLSISLGALSIELNAQELKEASNLRCKVVAWQNTPFTLDTLSIAEETITVTPRGKENKPGFIGFQYLFESNLFQLMNAESISHPDSVQICYRVFPYLFSRKTALREKVETDSGFLYQLPNRQKELGIQGLERDGILNATGIDQLSPQTDIERNGSLTRGVSFGSAQDVFVNSALNLQLSGQLTEDIDIEATLSDQQIPYQPEGNTQQLQEFDRVFIGLKHKKGDLSAGDLTFQNKPSEFLRYYKNVQGTQLNLNLGDTAQFHSKTTAGIAVAKGQFISQNIAPLEGVAGPYRLTGPRNERFIVVMANSEKVFLDGQQMQRGFNLDYVIDYNTAEITFTNRVLITRFSRIRVDFEYAVQNYARTIFQADQEFQSKKWKSAFRFYQEKDSRNNSLLFELTDEDKRLLSSVGDSVENAFSETAAAVDEFTPNQVLYTQKDTIVEAIAYQIFIRAREGDSPLFRVTFSETTGGGEYISAQPEANGRVFEWVSPSSNDFQTRYAPIRVLPAPNKRSMLTGAFEYLLSKHTSAFTEVALSDHDQNLFSEKGEEDNLGFATKMGVRVNNKPLKKWEKSTVNAQISYEYDQKNFRPIDRFRYVEFDRDWSIADTFPTSDQILSGSFQISKNAHNNFSYNTTLRNREGAARGIQQSVAFNKKEKWIKVKGSGFSMNSEASTTKADWLRIKGDVSYPGKKVVPGYTYQLDRNRVLSLETDSVVSTAMNFEAHRWYIQNSDSTALQYQLSYETRNDRNPIQGELQDFTKSETLNLSLQHASERSKIVAFFTYRTLKQQQLVGNPIEETVTGRLDWQTSYFKKAIQSELSFVSNAGRELRREFVFLAVDPGTGTHTWRDENEDGTQQLGEFYQAINQDERNFAKFFTPTNEYTPAFNTQIVHRLRVLAPTAWGKSKGIKWFLGRLTYSSSLQFQQKSTQPQLKFRLLPFIYQAEEENLLGGTASWRSELFFNKRSPKFGVELRNIINQRKQLLTNGFEKNNIYNHLIAIRLTSRKKITYRLELNTDRNRVASDLLNNRDIDIKSIGISPQFTFLVSSKFRVSANFSYKQKEDERGSSENNDATLSALSLQSRWNKGVSSLFSTEFNFTVANYDGKINSARGYALLEALQPGNNVQWKLNWSQRLKGGLQITMSYTGRKPEGAQVIHLGRMQVTALF